MTVLIADLETNGFLQELDRIWTLQIGTADGEDIEVYSNFTTVEGQTFRPLEEGIERLRRASQVVMHNGHGFDWWVLERFAPGAVPNEKVIDTLAWCRLVQPEERNHQLRTWGVRLNVAKGDYDGDFQTFTDDMVVYARQDITVTRALYRHLMKELVAWSESPMLEQRVSWAIALQEENGFLLDVPGAQELEGELRQEVTEIEHALQAVFPPIWTPSPVPVQERFKADWKGSWAPKKDNKKQGYTAGAPLTKVELQLFNPGSRAQAAERLMRLGWKPKVYTDGGAPQVDETTLSGLKYPEAKALVKYYQALKLLGQVSDGKSGWLKHVKASGRVHGRVNTNGAGTGRMTHSNPNLAQVSKDKRARRLWRARPGWKLVGCDAEGLEARELGHYLSRWDNGAFSERVVSGDKSKGTDVHTVNQRAVSRICAGATRDGAKRLLYALMYGAGDAKLGWTLKDDLRSAGVAPPRVPDRELGLLIRKALSKAMVGLDKLTEAVQKRAKTTGYVKGHDGRRIFIRSQHSALNSLLQGGGAIAMKKALVIFNDEVVPAKGWVHGVDFGYAANVHDEVQVEARPEIAEELGKAFADCITEAGVRLGIRCPLAGAYDIGDDWSETH